MWVEHISLSPHLYRASQKLRSILSAEISHDCKSISDSDVLVWINHVWNVWEVEVERIFDWSPALDREGRRVTLLVSNIIPRMLYVFKQISHRLSKSTDLPVAKDNFLLVFVLSLSIDRRFILSCISPLSRTCWVSHNIRRFCSQFPISGSNFGKAFVLWPGLLWCTTTHSKCFQTN